MTINCEEQASAVDIYEQNVLEAELRFLEMDEEAQQMLEALEEIKEAQEELDARKEAQEDAQKLVDDILDVIRGVSAELSDAFADRTALLAEDQEIRDKLDHLDDERVELKEEITELESSSAFDSGNESLPELEEARDTLAEVEALYTELLARMDAMADELMSAIERVDALVQQIENLKEQLGDAQEALIADLSDAEKALAEAQAAYAELPDEWKADGDKYEEWDRRKWDMELNKAIWMTEAAELMNHCFDAFTELYPDDAGLPDEFFERDIPDPHDVEEPDEDLDEVDLGTDEIEDEEDTDDEEDVEEPEDGDDDERLDGDDDDEGSEDDEGDPEEDEEDLEEEPPSPNAP